MEHNNQDTEVNKKERVFNLVVELLDIQAKKKDMMKGFNEEIKRLKAEIKDILD